MSAIVVVNPPLIEPVTVDEAKLFARIDGVLQDSLIAGLITAAREYCEAFTKRAFITTTFRMSLDRFPRFGDNLHSVQYPRRNVVYEAVHAQKIKLYRPPLIDVLQIDYRDIKGVTQTLVQNDLSTNPLGFLIDNDDEPGTIFPLPGTMWPVSLMIIPNNVKITYTAGYGDTADKVPSGIKTAIKQLVAYWFENRESSTELNLHEAPQAVDMLLTNHKIFDFSPTQG